MQHRDILTAFITLTVPERMPYLHILYEAYAPSLRFKLLYVTRSCSRPASRKPACTTHLGAVQAPWQPQVRCPARTPACAWTIEFGVWFNHGPMHNHLSQDCICPHCHANCLNAPPTIQTLLSLQLPTTVTFHERHAGCCMKALVLLHSSVASHLRASTCIVEIH